MIRDAFIRKDFGVKRDGKFVVLNVGDVREIIHILIEMKPKVEHLLTENDTSHAGISRYSATDALIGLVVERLVSNNIQELLKVETN